MKTKHVLRYFCDHCGRGHSKKPLCLEHEKSCALNPDRVCKVCDTITNHIMPLMIEDVIDGDMEKLKALSDCPSCIMAAIKLARKRSGDEVLRFLPDWNYKHELRRYHRKGMSAEEIEF